MHRRIAIAIGVSAALTLLSPQYASATSVCLPGTLQDYRDLLSPCTIDSAEFADFELLPLTAIATAPISPDLIQITPVGSGTAHIGFLFTLDSTASADDVFEQIFGYTVGVAAFNGARLSMSGFNVTGGSTVSTVENICVGGSFDPLLNCPGVPYTNIVFALVDPDGNLIEDHDVSVAFGANTFLHVVNDVVVDSGGTDTASLGAFQNLFDVTASTTPTPVPEPATGLMLAAGLGAILRRARPSGRS